MSIFPSWLGTYGIGETVTETVYIEVPDQGIMGGGIKYKQITVTAKIMINKRKKKIKIKAKLI